MSARSPARTGPMLPAHAPEPWVRRGRLVEIGDGRLVASVCDAGLDPATWERAPDTAERIVECVNALEGARRPAQAVDDARYALALAYDWLEGLRSRLGADGLHHILTDTLAATGRDGGIATVRDAMAALGETQEAALARELMSPARAPGPGDCEACEGLGHYVGTRCPDCGGTGLGGSCRDCGGTGVGGSVGLRHDCVACGGAGRA